ncbi:hypothetical protein LUZ60_004324 [Juncus effusus]|nr:hypothetical protein LUZ60_004324 [Juncus effusus]
MAGRRPITAYWAAEYLLRRRDLPAGIANSLLLSLPNLPPSCPSPPSLRHLIYLRKLSSSRLINSQTLHAIEMLHFLNPSPNPNPVVSTAFLYVAVYLTVMSENFPRAVEILFTQRIGDMIGSPEAAGLVSDRMREVKEEMEKAVVDLEVRERVLNMEGIDVNEAIWDFVEKEWEITEKRQSFVEIAADVAVGVPGSESAWMELAAKERPMLIQMEEARKQTAQTENQTGDHLQAVQSNGTSTPEADKIQNRLKSGVADLLQTAPDPLPEAIEKANRAQMEALTIKDKGKKVISDEGTSKGGGNRSIMDRNPTAVTYEWNDSIESDSDKSREKTKKRRLPSLKPWAAVSPLRIVENNQKISHRRKPKKWTTVEEETLIKGVNEHGKGNWKAILNSYPDVFEDRTDVDLKDKWRNMHKN